MEVIRIVRKTKALALLSIIVAATVFGAVIFSVSATEDGINEMFLYNGSEIKVKKKICVLVGNSETIC